MKRKNLTGHNSYMISWLNLAAASEELFDGGATLRQVVAAVKRARDRSHTKQDPVRI